LENVTEGKELGVGAKVILKYILRAWKGRACSGFI
jgi:hypothetical protein